LVPFVLQGRILINIDINKILAGAKFRGEFEQRFQRLIDEVLETPNVIVFIDEIHTICSSGSTDGSLDAASILKPILSRSGFQCIGATTQKEYDIIKKDSALDRRFQEIIVEEPTIPETISILYGIRPNLEKHHNLQILPSTLKASVELASRYIQDKFFPDKAIDLLDRAAAQQVLSL
ncbi:MAG: ATP-dependent Clp protease ATP-binding subunit, partial [bacterium]|nr:ATP-dependent Clp protease ATP-binding subunit [bacterium]